MRKVKGGEEIIDIKDINSQLGLGASLFMMTTKAMGWFFIYMTILNIPAMIFFYQGNDASNDANQSSLNATFGSNVTATKAAKSSISTQIFAQLSLGNVGENIASCSELDLTVNRTLSTQLSCSYGKMLSLSKFGFVKSKQTKCSDNVGMIELHKECSGW